MASSVEDRPSCIVHGPDATACDGMRSNVGRYPSQHEDEDEEEEEDNSGLPEPGDADSKLADPEWMEERFRIDRKKLETMLHTPPDDNGLTGEEFFKKVMIETNTQIKWPSKLKIGAKSKKDPHVKVEGKRSNVLEAKNKILDVLETKVNKVTLKIDVTHTEHSHVIGKGGGNIKKVMEVTECHIHFPDSNRHNITGEKSNQVSIAGPIEGVESARRKIRDLQPLVLTFDLPVALAPQVLPEAASPVVQHVAQAFGVAVSFRQQPRFYTYSCIVRGLQGNAASVKKATCVLMELLLGAENHGMVSTQLDISSQQHLLLLGHSGTSFLSVMHLTQTQIILPDLSDPQSPPSLLIQGAPDGVCLARQQLLDCLPVCLMFDVRDSGEAEPHKISQLMHTLGVFISIKPKVKQTAKSVVVKTLEKNVCNLYEARRLLLGLESTEVSSIPAKLTCDIPLANINSHWLNVILQQLQLADPGGATAPEDMVAAVRAPPPPPPGLSLVQQDGTTSRKAKEPNLEKISQDKGQQSSSDQEASLPEEKGLEVKEKLALSSRRNSGSETAREQMQDGNITLSHQVATQNNSMQTSHTGSRCCRAERRNNTREETTQMTSTSNEDCDYEKKRLLAAKAMQKKPVQTEVRTPTDTWSGLGFSRSMPAEAMKELRSVSRRSYRSYLGNNMLQTWTQSSKDKSHSGSDSENWRERRGSSPSPSLLSLSSSYSSSSLNASFSSSSFVSSSSRSTVEKSSDSLFEDVSSESTVGQPTQDLPELFEQLGLSKYTDVFQEQEIDFQTFLTLSDADLKEIGVSTFGARRKMLLAITDLNKNKKKNTDPPTVKPGYLEGGASGRLPRIMDVDVTMRSGRW